MNKFSKTLIKMLSIFMVLIFLANNFNIGTALGEINSEEDPYGKIKELEKEKEELEKLLKPTPTQPRISVIKPASYVDMNAGDTKDIEVEIKNVTSDIADKVLTEFKPSPEPKIKGSFVGENYFKIIQGNTTKKLKLRISLEDTLESGLYNLTLVHKLTNNVGDDLSQESIIQFRVTNNIEKTNLVIEDIKIDSDTVIPGENFNLTASLINKTGQEAKDVQVTIEGMLADAIHMRDSSNILDVTTIKANGNSKIDIGLTSNKKIPVGTYPVTLNLAYTTLKGEKETKNYTYYINISKDKSVSTESSELIVENISSVGKTVGVGENFTMNVKIKNIGNDKIENIKIKAITNEGAEGVSGIVPKSTSIMQVKNLAKGGTESLSFTFAATKNSKSQNYVVGFEVSYETGKLDAEDNKEILSFIQYQGVNVSNPEADKEEDKEKEEEKISIPKIIIDNYTSSPMIVQAGTEFDLNMTFKNTSSKAVKNIKVVFTVEEATTDSSERKGNVFTPVGSSNTFYIDNISPTGQISRSIRLFTIPDASPKNYPITVSMEYEDMENNPYKSEDIIGINVKQKSKIDTSEISSDEFVDLGNPVYISFQLYNTGKVKLSNVKVDIKGNFDATQGSQFFGNLNVSSSEYYDGTVFPTEVGTQTGTVIISYEDETGEALTEEKTFSVEVMEPMPMELDENGNPIFRGPDGEIIDMGEQEGKSKLPIIIGAIVTLIIIIVIVVIVLRKRKIKKDLEIIELDELMAEEERLRKEHEKDN